MLLQVLVLEDLAAFRNLRRQRALATDLRRPKARREHVHCQLDAVHLRAAAVGEPKGVLRVGRRFHVDKHALELRGELVAALVLELGDHRALGVVRDRPAAQQPLRQVLLVVLLEDVLLLQVAEEHHHLVERLLDLLLRRALHPLAQLVVDKERDVLGGVLVKVDEVFERLVQRVGELLVVFKGLLNHLLVLVAQRQQPLHVQHRVALVLLLLHQLGATRLHVRRHNLANHREARRRLRHALEELVHARQVLHFVVLEHHHAARVFHLCQLPHMSRNQLALGHFLDLWLCARIKVVRHAVLLLEQPPLCLLHVVGRRVLRQVLVRFDLVKVGRALQEGLLEVLAVDLQPQLEQHACDRLDQPARDHLASALARHQVEKHLQQPVLDARVAHDLVRVRVRVRVRVSGQG